MKILAIDFCAHTQISKLTRYIFILIAAIFIQGCATSTPAPQVDMSGYSKAAPGMAGIYFYQWKTGIFGSLSDVKFVLDGQVLGSINTGEWMYLEVLAGEHKYRLKSGLIPIDIPHQFTAGQNYFFIGKLNGFTDSVVWINDIEKINEVVVNMESGRYKRK